MVTAFAILAMFVREANMGQIIRNTLGPFRLLHYMGGNCQSQVSNGRTGRGDNRVLMEIPRASCPPPTQVTKE